MTNHPRGRGTEYRCAQRAEVIRGILEREAAGLSISAMRVSEEQHDLYLMARLCYGNWSKAIAGAGLDPQVVAARRTWTPERIVRAIHDLDRCGIALNHNSIKKLDQSLAQAARLRFGSWDDALRAAGYEPSSKRRCRHPWTKSELVALLQERARVETTLSLNALRPISARFAIKRLFGTFAAALRVAAVAHKAPHRERKWSRNVVLQAIQERHASGYPLNCATVLRSNCALRMAALRFFDTWNHALRAAGFDPRQIRLRPLPWTAKDVRAELRRRAQSGRAPVAISSMRPTSFMRACTRFFGSFEAAAAAARVDPARICYHRDRRQRAVRE